MIYRYVYVDEPLLAEEADRLCQACKSTQEKLVIWTLLDTGLMVSELCSLVPQYIKWEQKTILIKKRIVPMSNRVYKLLAHYLQLITILLWIRKNRRF